MNVFFNPKSVAVIGASGNPGKVGFALVSNLIKSKVKVYPVSLKEKEISGLTAVSSVLEISEPVDLAIIAVPAANVPQVLEECGKKQIPNAIIVSSGFREIGEAGQKLEEQIIDIAKNYNLKILGPNCLGVIDANSGLNASFAGQMPIPGKIALLSQSGALGTAMIDWANSENVGFSKFISLGNEAMLDEISFLECLKDDPDTRAILIYLERINSGREFVELVKSITSKKPVVVLKAGVSSYGASAIMSHTGSLAPESKVFSAALRQVGAIVVPSLRKFFNMAKLLSLGMDVSNPVRNLAVITNGGGPSVIAADEIGVSNWLTLPALDEEAKNKLRAVLPPMASVSNPVDIIGDALAERYEKALKIILDVSEIQGVLLMLTPQMMTEAEATARMLGQFRSARVKIFPVFIGGASVEAGRRALRETGLVSFSFSKDIITGLDDMASVAAYKNPEIFSAKHQNKLRTNSGKGDSVLAQMPFEKMTALFREYGLEVAGKFIRNKEDLNDTLAACGAGPYVMKAVSALAVHKTEAGIVRVGITNSEQASGVWEELWTNPKVMGNVEGIVVQRTEKGREVIIGMKRDANFGPVILFGLGGIFTEALQDSVLRVAPIEKEEALRMMREIKGYKILEGMRGEPPVNLDALADIIFKLSELSLDHHEIKEIDLNPVMASADSAVIVDARVMV